MAVARPLLVLAVAVALSAGLLWWPAAAPMPGPGGPLAPARKGWRCVGEAGLELGQFKQPRGITAFPDGSFVVMDRASRVQRFDAQGRALSVWEMKEHGLGNPKGLAALPDGSLLVCDTHYGRLLTVSASGEILRQWGQPGTEAGNFVHPLSCAVDSAAGVVYVAEYGGYNDRVQKFKLDGTFLKTWGTFGLEPGQFRRPSGVALDAAGNVFVADAVNHRIQKFDPEGKLLKIFGVPGKEPGELEYPYDIACAPDGTLYVAEFNNHRVSAFDGEGNFLRVLGAAGERLGEFNSPWSLTCDSLGRLLVSDTKNNRVQVLEVSRPAGRAVAAAR